jgi:hypothetical protein
MSLVMDLHIVQDRFGSISDLNLNGHLHYPNDIDKSLDETTTERSESIDLTTIMTPLRLSQCTRDVWIPQFEVLVFHHNDTHRQVFSLSLTQFID